MNSPSVQMQQAVASLTWTSPYAPDYVTLNVDVYVISGTVTYTRYGDIWTGKGFNWAYPYPKLSSRGFNVSAGYFLCPGTPNPRRLNDFLSNWSTGAGYYDLIGGSVSGNGSGAAINLGFGIGGGGANASLNTYQGNLVSRLLP